MHTFCWGNPRGKEAAVEIGSSQSPGDSSGDYGGECECECDGDGEQVTSEFE